MPYKMKAYLKTDPIEYEDFKKTHKQRTIRYELVDRDFNHGFDNFYMKLVYHRHGIKLKPSQLVPHVTAIKAFELKYVPEEFIKNMKKEIEIELYPEDIKQVFHFWVIPVKCQYLTDIRRQLKLKKDYQLHITIGRLYEDNTYPLDKEDVIHPKNLTHGMEKVENENTKSNRRRNR